jgi:DNA-binding LacI/PurR family transcriptional regulator
MKKTGSRARNARITLKNVAEECGYSVMTVSSILNGKAELFRQKTRDKVQQAADKLGYLPHRLARVIREGRFGNVAFLVGSSGIDAWFSEALLRTAAEEFGLYDMRLTVESLLPSIDKLTSEHLPPIMKELSVDAVLCDYVSGIPVAFENCIRSSRLPWIWVNRKTSADCIYPDDIQGSIDAVSYLVETGHRRIVFITRQTAFPHQSYYDRFEGYISAMTEKGLRPCVISPDHVITDADRYESLSSALASPNPPTAALLPFQSDVVAILSEASSRRCSVPGDLTFVTFGDYPSKSLDGVLNYVAVPFEEMGRLAVEMTLQKIKSPDTPLPPRILRMKLCLARD